MDERRLPQPATNADEYLYDIALSLRSIVGVLAAMPVLIHRARTAAPPPTDGEVALKEPEPPKRKHRG